MTTNLFGSFAMWSKKNSSLILLGTGLTGMATSMIVAARASVQLSKEIEQKKIKEDRLRLTKKEKAKMVLKHYTAPAIVFALSTASIVSSFHVDQRRNLALASALTASEAALNEYQRHVVSTVGEATEKSIQESIAKERIEKATEKIPSDTLNLIASSSSVNCIEATTNQRFESDKETIRKIENDLNQERLTGFGNVVSLNQLYTELGVKETPLGDSIGWNVDNPIEIEITAVEHNGIPFLYVNPKNWRYLYD